MTGASSMRLSRSDSVRRTLRRGSRTKASQLSGRTTPHPSERPPSEDGDRLVLVLPKVARFQVVEALGPQKRKKGFVLRDGGRHVAVSDDPAADMVAEALLRDGKRRPSCCRDA